MVTNWPRSGSCGATGQVSLEHGTEDLLDNAQLCGVWVLSNLSTLRALTSGKKPLGECCMLLTPGAGGNLAEQNKVMLRTKWLAQSSKNDSRLAASLVSATGFSLSAFEPR